MSRVLCTTHNNALGPFDAFASAFDDELRRIAASSTVSTHIQFNGNNLERWMLKTLCALLASGSARKQDATTLFSEIPEFWVDVLFGGSHLAPPLGLYVSGTIGEQWDISDRSIGMAPVSIGNRVVGLTLQMQWLQCTLMMTTWNGRPAGAINEQSIRRPAHLRVLRGAAQHTIQFMWDSGPGPGVEIMYTPGEGA
ncbi:MAG: hypothetical protein KC776_33900 [Myxococcales bacterium]|nr:hypothetical protein [Myxococcales bacterium]MCB9575630.1 hypothetical protein [Polyangiaceae bacterium]